MACKHLLQRKAPEPFCVEADSIALQPTNFLFVLKRKKPHLRKKTYNAAKTEKPDMGPSFLRALLFRHGFGGGKLVSFGVRAYRVDGLDYRHDGLGNSALYEVAK